MADETLDQRLTRIEAALHRLIAQVTDGVAEAKKTRAENRIALARAAAAAHTFGERVERLEKRDPPATG